jgi:hypothetical protein
MATTVALVLARPNLLRYLATADAMGGLATIPNDAGVTPDLQTDTATVGGPVRNMIVARLNGYGAIAAGALNQAQARSVFCGDGAGAGNANIPRGRLDVIPRTGVTTWIVDANVDGGGDPTIEVTASAAAGTAYVELSCPGAIGAQ